jgi:hypothetical protein
MEIHRLASELRKWIKDRVPVLPMAVTVLKMDELFHTIRFRLHFRSLGITQDFDITLESLSFMEVAFPWGMSPVYVSEWQCRMAEAAFFLYDEVIAAIIWYWLHAYLYMAACEVPEDAFRIRQAVFTEMWTLNVKEGRSLYEEFLLAAEASIKNINKPANAKIQALAQLL